jgi:hypothetical protein
MSYAPVIQILASAAQAASGSSTSSTISDSGGGFGFGTLSLEVDLTAFTGGTSPTVTIAVQWSHLGTSWASASPVDSFTAISAAGSVVQQFKVKGTFARVTWTSTGTPTSITFGVTGYLTV